MHFWLMRWNTGGCEPLGGHWSGHSVFLFLSFGSFGKLLGINSLPLPCQAAAVPLRDIPHIACCVANFPLIPNHFCSSSCPEHIFLLSSYFLNVRYTLAILVHPIQDPGIHLWDAPYSIMETSRIELDSAKCRWANGCKKLQDVLCTCTNFHSE